MGDWKAVNWDDLDTPTLVHILSGVWEVLANRLLIRFPFQQSQNVPAPPVVSPSGSFTVISEPTAESQANPLLVPYRCQFSCRWCNLPCGRTRQGHRHHSCFNCRHLR